MRFLVTGATGFAGPHMINRILTDGNEVVAMVRNINTCRDIENVLGKENIEKVEFVYGDLSVLDSLSNIFVPADVQFPFSYSLNPSGSHSSTFSGSSNPM